jgi:hypothetical protein
MRPRTMTTPLSLLAAGPMAPASGLAVDPGWRRGCQGFRRHCPAENRPQSGLASGRTLARRID